MKNKIIVLLLIVGAILCVFFCKLVNTEKDANQIFYESMDFIVELVAETSSQKSYGSAVFIDTNLLVTNAHVVTYKSEGTVVPHDSFSIRFAKETDFRIVSLLKYDETLDIAVLQFEDDDIEVKGIEVGDSSALDFGNTVYAIGNSMNGGLSISKGIIGVPDVIIEYEGITREVIQADIAIASGNSGGALLDSNGRLVGITSFRIKDLSGNVVYGNAYSIPINQVLLYIRE